VSAWRARTGRGFTIIELLIVMVIMSILAAIAIPMYLNQRQHARDANAREGGRTITTAVQMYILDEANPSDTLPPSADKATLTPAYLDPKEWPQNMYAGRDMQIGDGTGDYAYEVVATPKRFLLTVHLGSGEDFKVP